MGKGVFFGLSAVFLIALAMLRMAEAQNYAYPTGYNSPFAFGGTSDYSGQKKPIFGEGGIQLGPLKITPGVSLNTTYTSNAQMQTNGQQSDFITSISPTFAVTLGQGLKIKDFVSFGYSGNLGAYTKITGDDYTTHTLWADINLMQRPTTYMKLREALTYTNNPFGNQQFIGQGVANTRMINQTDFTVGRKLPRDYAVELGYQNQWQNYFDNTFQSQSSVTNTLKPTLLYELTGKTQLLAQYSCAYWNYYEQPSAFAPNYFVHELQAGFRWAASSRLSGEVKAGYGVRRYTNHTDLLGVPYQNNGAPIGSINLQYTVSPKTSINFQALRNYNYGGYLNPLSNRLDVLESGYLQNATELRVTTNPRKDVSLGVFIDYELDQYDSSFLYPNRTDSFYGAGLTFSQQLRRYLSWGLTYTYQNRNSPLPGNSYAVNMVSASLSLSY
jgi:polysaccharide biosynthesis protein VpsM